MLPKGSCLPAEACTRTGPPGGAVELPAPPLNCCLRSAHQEQGADAGEPALPSNPVSVLAKARCMVRREGGWAQSPGEATGQSSPLVLPPLKPAPPEGGCCLWENFGGPAKGIVNTYWLEQ